MDTTNLTTPVTPNVCTSSSSSTSSPPQYSDDIRKTTIQDNALLLGRKGSASSTKTCEVNLGEEERDTFSPVSSNNSPDDHNNDIFNDCNGDAGTSATIRATLNHAPTNNNTDNKHLEDTVPSSSIKLKSHNTTLTNSNSHTIIPSKEEKQRQNEEIVILETSSISSETGSWESVFPHNINVNTSTMNSIDTHNINMSTFCIPDFMQQTKQEEDTNVAINFERDRSTTSQCLTRQMLLEAKQDDPLTTSQTSNCFIDASSLVDDEELLLLPGEVQILKQVETANGTTGESPTKQLEEFHRSFARCKTKIIKDDVPLKLPTEQRPHSSSSCSSDEIISTSQNRKISGGDSTSNISDEEKLWKRDRQHYESESETKSCKRNINEHPENVAPLDETTEASVSLAHDIDSSDSSELIKSRREQERKFPLYNSHTNTLPTLTNKLLQHCNQSAASLVNNTPTIHHNDHSYTTDYSSSSPAPSLVWSEYEHQRPSNYHRSMLNEDYEIIRKKNACLLPETPHNSIVHVEPTSSNTSSIHRDYTMSSSLSHNRDSGAYCSDATDSPIPMPRTPKRTKFDEINPIISGGSCIKDFQIKQCNSPPILRKTDACPIISGGFVSMEFEADSDYKQVAEGSNATSAKSRKPISGIASWVVDMSDCQRNERRKSTSSTSSLEAFQSKFRERSDSNSSRKSGCGFFVSLNEFDTQPTEPKETHTNPPKDKMISTTQMSKSCDAPTSTKFFINLSTSEYKPKETMRKECPLSAKTETEKSNSENNSQKNLFSMFIDIGNGEKKQARPVGRKEPFNLNERLSGQRKMEDTMKSSASSTETLMSKSITQHLPNKADSKEVNINTEEAKSLDYAVNMEPTLNTSELGRLNQQQQVKQHTEINKRHSWSINSSNDLNNAVCKRSISFTNNDERGTYGRGLSKGLMNIIDKIPIISKTSSMSIDNSMSPHEENTFSKSELSVSSGAELEETGAVIEMTRVKKRRQDVKINETYDKSSLASITDGIISKDMSPISNTDTDDLTFQQDEEQALRDTGAQSLLVQQQLPSTQICVSAINSTSNRMSNIIMETIIEAKEISSPKQAISAISLETLHATIEKQKKLLETVNEHSEIEKCNFVKLSDMDKPMKTNVKSPDRMSTSVGNHRQISRVYRDDNRIRPHSWTMTRSTGNSFLNITSSVENMRSLSRLFPNFSKEISSSLPNDMGLDNGIDYIQTDLSAESSLASSISRSGMDESSISCRQPRRLGEDLLKMFLQEVATDMIVEVHGRRIKAHKCILRSRCQYFAAMLAGNQTTSVVSLQGYSYSAVHFALCHIYSGASHPPEGISLMELAALADLLGLEGLKEVTSHALKINYCHNFHKPCSGCVDGILQVLPVALNHALDDLYRKCLRWTCRHYLKVWPTRQFAQLPPDVLGRCRQQIVAYLTSETVLDTILDCENLLAQLATYRWGNVCEGLVRDILDAAYAYITDHFASLIASDSFLSLGHDRSCHIPLLEGVLLRTASSLTPDQVCRSYQRITRLNTVLQAKIIQMPANLGELAKELQGLQEEELEWDPEYIRLVSALLSAIEQCLIRQCSRAMRVTSWQRMDLDLRKKIQTLARLTEPIDLKRNRGVSKASSFGGNTRTQDLHQVKLAIQAHTKKSSAKDTQLYKATQTQESVQTIEKGVQASQDPREARVIKTNSKVHVPIQHRGITQSSIGPDRSSRSLLNANNHRRTKSEAPAPTITNNVPKCKSNDTVKKSETKTKIIQPIKLSDVKPRYMEPKKTVNNVRGPVRSSTTSSIPGTTNTLKKSFTHSSSGSSRRSSPATRRHINTKATGIKSTTNMSLDSLASPTNRRGRCKTSRSSDNDRFSDVFVDSLESINTHNKTVSHESLSTNRLSKFKGNSKISGSNKNISNGNVNSEVKLNEKVTKGKYIKEPLKKPIRPTSLGAKPTTKYIQQKITSTGSSPSSITTTKSATSRLSSVSSTQSARAANGNSVNYKRSISVPGHNDTQGGAPKFSFLSAKSREILARRAEKNKQLQEEQQRKQQEHQYQQLQQQQQQHQHQHQQRQKAGSEEEITSKTSIEIIRSASNSSVMAAPRTQSITSSIPTRRPNTLQLKKTSASSAGGGGGGGGSDSGTGNSSGIGLTVHSSQQNNCSNQNNKNKTTNSTRSSNLLQHQHMKLQQQQQQRQQQKYQKSPATQAIYQTAQAVKQKIELLIKSSNHITTHDTSTTRKANNDNNAQITTTEIPTESKLERSSTFCKDSSEMGIDFNELHIIE